MRLLGKFVVGLQAHGSWINFPRMSSVTASDLKGIAENEINRFDKVVAGIPLESPSLFHEEASRLEAGLLGVYRVVVTLVRQEEDMAKVAACWAAMVGICDKYAERLGALRKAQPACGVGFFYDRILDLRNKCARLQSLHA